MREKIRNILEREIARLDHVSQTRPGLDDFEIRSLVALVKAAQEFMAEAPKQLAPNDPGNAGTDELLAGVVDE